MEDKNKLSGVEHYPVMLDYVLKHWINVLDGLYVDCTFGLGSHTKHLLQHLSSKAKVIGVDVDVESQKHAHELEKKDLRFKFLKLNFADFFQYWKQHNLPSVNGILFDLGLSTAQLKNNNRGFSYNLDGNLDMRMNMDSNKTAAYILNTYSKKDLFHIFKQYGEIKNPRKLVDIISEYRRNNDFETTEDFLKIIDLAFPKNKFKFNKNQAKLFFQALRIETNNEIQNLETALEYLEQVVAPSGYALFITFHSLEERILKKWIDKNCRNIVIESYGTNYCSKFKLLNNKYITPSQTEIFNNWASRSAKLWVFQKSSSF